MRIDVLGPLRIEREGEPLPLASGRQRALLANLLIAAGDTVAPDELIDAVWGEDLPSNPTNTLQHGIAQLRKLLEPERVRGEPSRLLVSDQAGYRLELGGIESDVVEFEEAIADGREQLGRHDAAAATRRLRSALDLWRGRAYADFAYTDFARAEADRLDEMRIQCRELLVDAEMEAAGPAAVVPDLEALVIEYPFRESLWVRLMTALYQSGRQAEALRVFQEASEALADELGIPPTAELRSLEERILLQDPSLAPRERSSTPHNLPARTTTLVGRDNALADVKALLRTVRLITLLGPGGSGKTRLAVEAAARMIDDFSDGVWLVRLDELADADLFEATVGHVVGMPEDREKDVIETLATFLAPKRLLLVLDNCEHLVDRVARTVDRLLAQCPTLVVLATSQVALAITGEHRFPVPPLRLPGDLGSPFDELEAVPAVELFLERAAAVDPAIDRSAPSIAAIANIVRALDGIPLAIELAAARTDVLTPTELAHRLSDRFEVLDIGPRAGPERQQTLRKTVEWGVGLLDPVDQAFFFRLGVFAGDFDAAAAASVTGTTERDALATLGRLLQRSLLTRDQSAGLSRFRLLETLRLFGVDRLEAAGALAETRHLHLRYYAALVRDLDQALGASGQLVAFARMLREQDNVRAAMAWSLESGELGAGIQIAARSSRFWDWRGSLAEASTWMNRFIDMDPEEALADMALLTSWAGYFAWELGREHHAAVLVAEAARIARAEGDRFAEAAALTGAALQARVHGDAVAAVQLAGEVRDIGVELGDRWLVAWADNHDGLSLLAAGDPTAAEASAEASREAFASLGDRRATGWALTVLAQVAHEQGEQARTMALAEEAVVVSREAGDGRNAAWALELAAEAAKAEGDTFAADRYEADAASLLQERGMPASPWHRAE